ncbi:MAG TPA: SgcJ/EcaC family oxidoreductase [Gemmatimonadota bacterium]|jgi:putative oxidoreductase
MDGRTSTFRSIALNLLRIVAGLLFMQHGAMKLFGALGGVDGEGGTVPVGSLFWVAGVLEVFGGAAVVLGLFTRVVAFVLSGEMAVAYFKAHLPRGFWPIENGGEPAVLFCFVFLFLAANGGGRFSLDGVFRRGRARLGDEPARVEVRSAAMALAIAVSALGAPLTAQTGRSGDPPAADATPAAPAEAAAADTEAAAPTAVGAVTGARAPSNPAETEAFRAWDAVYETFRRGYREADADAVAAVYADDAFYLGPGRDVVRGRPAILETFRPFLEGAPAGTYDVTFEILAREVADDLGYEVGFYDLRVRKPDGEGRSRGKFTVVWKRGADGAWRIQSDTYSGVGED